MLKPPPPATPRVSPCACAVLAAGSPDQRLVSDLMVPGSDRASRSELHLPDSVCGKAKPVSFWFNGPDLWSEPWLSAESDAGVGGSCPWALLNEGPGGASRLPLSRGFESDTGVCLQSKVCFTCVCMGEGEGWKHAKPGRVSTHPSMLVTKKPWKQVPPIFMVVKYTYYNLYRGNHF